jgi:hypothetical protein
MLRRKARAWIRDTHSHWKPRNSQYWSTFLTVNKWFFGHWLFHRIPRSFQARCLRCGTWNRRVLIEKHRIRQVHSLPNLSPPIPTRVYSDSSMVVIQGLQYHVELVSALAALSVEETRLIAFLHAWLVRVLWLLGPLRLLVAAIVDAGQHLAVRVVLSLKSQLKFSHNLLDMLIFSNTFNPFVFFLLKLFSTLAIV